MTRPRLRQVVLDAVDVRALAEFYRELLGLSYRPGDEPTAAPSPDVHSIPVLWTSGEAVRPAEPDWLVLRDGDRTALAFQAVDELPEATWPDGPVPQQLHLDLTVPTVDDLEAAHERALGLGARLLLDRSDDPDEPLRVYADPAGHPFCIFVG